jgi:hypothetical protein
VARGDEGACCREGPAVGVVIRTGKLVIDVDTRVVELDDPTVHLTGTECLILELLSLHKGTRVTKETLFNHFYREDDEPEMKIIDAFIRNLGKKLAQTDQGKYHIVRLSGAAVMRCAIPNVGRPYYPDGAGACIAASLTSSFRYSSCSTGFSFSSMIVECA